MTTCAALVTAFDCFSNHYQVEGSREEDGRPGTESDQVLPASPDQAEELERQK